MQVCGLPRGAGRSHIMTFTVLSPITSASSLVMRKSCERGVAGSCAVLPVACDTRTSAPASLALRASASYSSYALGVTTQLARGT